jgi:chemotaxis protein methyltransferase CheR
MVRDRWFVPVGAGRFTLVAHLKERASFACHNLMDSPYPVAAEGQGFDLIACRNVLIYFTSESFDRVVGLLSERLAPEGLLMLSAAEPLLRTPPGLRTVRCEQAFFYARAQEPAPSTSAVPPMAPRTPSSSGLPAVGSRQPVVRTPSSSGLPAVGSRLSLDAGPPPATTTDRASEARSSGRFPAVSSGSAPEARSSGRFPAIGAERPPAPPVLGGPVTSRAHSEAEALFAQVLEWAAEASEVSPQTADTLRRCLTLDPDLASARYLLGMVLEQRGALAEAAAEYRKALRSLEEGRARATPFYLNNARLQVACARAIERVERAAGSTPTR